MSTLTRRGLLRLGLGSVSVAALAACAGPAPTQPAQPGTSPAQPAAAASTPAAASQPTQPPAATTVAQPAGGRPTWEEAAKQFAGKTINAIEGASDATTSQGKLFEQFSQATGLKVNLEPFSGGDYRTKVQAEVTGRSGNYDVLAIFTGDVGRYAQAGAIVPLDDFLNDPTLPDYQLNDYPDAIIDSTMRTGGKIVGLVEGGNCQIMFCRKDLLEAAGLQPPKDWNELYEAARKLRKGDVYGASLDLKDVLAAVRFGNALPPDLSWLDKNNRLSALRDPRTAATLDIWHKLYAEDLIPKDSIANDLTGSLNIYLTGKAAMLPLSWPSSVPGTENPKNSQVVGKTTYAPVPGGAPNASGWTWGISVDSKNPKAAYLAVGWLTSPDISRRAVAEYAIFDQSLRKSTITPDVEAAVGKLDQGAAKLAGLQAMSASWPKARFQPAVTPWGKVLDTIAPFFQKAVVGDLPAADALNQAADAGDKVLQDAGL
jgi:multiple sugar transport system substrate-binding protein